jgi:membrane-bound metal-dependent hydrolase YbcI (DUF457 family)
MMGKTHVGFGLLFTAAGLPVVCNGLLGMDFSTGEMVAGVAIGAIAGVLPDIDHPDSLITKGIIPGTRRLGFIAKVVGWLLAIPARAVGMFARQIGAHRGPTHSLVFAVGWTVLATPLYVLFFSVIGAGIAALATTIFQFFPVVGNRASSVGHVTSVATQGVWSHIFLIGAAVGLGYISHLFSDGLTNAPNMYFWPFSQKKRHLQPLKPLRVTTDSFTEKLLVRPLIYGLAILAFGYFIVVPSVSGYTSKHFPKQKQQIQQKLHPQVKKK